MPQSVFKCSSWLTAFLLRRGLQTPDQRALYEYHCSSDEYLELQYLLSSLGSFDTSVSDTGGCACLVLFCSEWYRRQYQADHGWSWEPIWQVVGYRLSAIDLSKAIPRGLEGYWKRPVHSYESERRNFLGSLFAEGGLPFQVLREEGSRFYTLFNRVLKQNDQWQLMGHSTLHQVEKLLETANLPQVFSSPPSVELIARMADQLLALVRDYSLEQANEPVAQLNARNPKWRELFPLPLDNETGSELLNGLLKTATSERKRHSRAAGAWACLHFWHEGQPDTLRVQVSLPSEVRFSLSATPSTTRFELALMEAGQVIAALGPGYAVVDGAVAIIKLRQREVMARRIDLASQLSLVAIAGGMVIGTIPIRGSIVALGEVPVGFEPADDRWQLCGQASFSTASEDLLVVLPPESTANEVDESEGETSISTMPSVCSSPAIRVQGKARLQVKCGDSDSYSIRTGRTVGAGLGLELDGVRLPWEARPALTFVGLPKAQWPGTTDELQVQGGQLYVGGKLLGSGVLQEMLGSQYVAVRNRSGDTLLRRKVGILPADFHIELRSGEGPGQGSILVHTQQPCLLQIADESIRVQQLKGDGHAELRLSCVGIPPISFHLTITPSLLADPIVLVLPFPSSGCLAFDASGQPLKRDICVDDLLGTRLYLFGRNGAPTKFGIELTLKGHAARNASYSWSYTAAERPLEISLYSIREQIVDLLSLHSDIDQVVELRVFGNRKDSIYRIRRYAAAMRLQSDTQTLIASQYQDGSSELPEPVLMLLHEPMRGAVSLTPRRSEGVPTGEFELPALIEKSGPWLVVPKSGSTVSFRPLFVAGGWEPSSQTDDAQSLQKAVLIFEHAAPVSSFTSVLNAMSINPMHSGWQFIRALFDSYGYLPLATFEVWKALMANTRALSMALFKFEMAPAFLGRIEAEFPVLWELMPVADIHKATRQFGSLLKSRGLADEVSQGLLSKMLSRLSEVFPAYGESVQRYLSDQAIGPDISVPRDVFRVIVHGWYLDLLRDRSDATWPEFGGSKLKRWALSQADNVISFTPEMDYRSAVVYLPVFAAAVASGKAFFTDVFEDSGEAVFFLRQVRDFDSNWFNSVYQYCLLNAVINSEEAAPINE